MAIKASLARSLVHYNPHKMFDFWCSIINAAIKGETSLCVHQHLLADERKCLEDAGYEVQVEKVWDPRQGGYYSVTRVSWE